MRAIEAKTFSGCGGLRQTELPEPRPGAGPRHGQRRHAARSDDPVGWTPSSQGAAGAQQSGRAGIIEDAGESGFAVGSRVMFTRHSQQRHRVPLHSSLSIVRSSKFLILGRTTSGSMIVSGRRGSCGLPNAIASVHL